VWLKSLIEAYPKQIEVAIFPTPQNSKELPADSLFDHHSGERRGGVRDQAVRRQFAVRGGQFPERAHAADDDRRARLALRYILSNPAITAPIPGLMNIHQVDNAVQAVQERRQLDRKEKAELDEAGRRMWAGLHPGHEMALGLGVRMMRRILLVVLFAVGAWAADISGKWKGEWTDSRDTPPYTFTFTQDGASLTGTVGTGDGDLQIRDGKVSGDRVSFVVVRKVGARR